MTLRESFCVEPANESHLPGILAIYNQAVRETFSVWTETEATLAQRRTWLDVRRSAGHPVFAALDTRMGGADDRPVIGYSSYGPFRDFPGYAGTVELSVYVAPHAHRRGVGGALLDAVIDHARGSGLHTMVAGVDAGNTPSIALHESRGFALQGKLIGVGRKFGRALDLALLVKSLERA